MTELRIPLLDLLIIVAYLAGIVAVGILSVRKQKLTSDMYFLAGRSLNWAVIGAALFASNISTIHLVGLAASGYNEGVVWGNFEWMATVTLVLLSLVFAPFYFKTHISTLPEFLERRYSPAARSLLAFMAIVGALFIHIGMSLYAGATVFDQFFGIDVITSIVIISVLTGIYTVLGGLTAVVVTETIQTVLLILGAVIITVAGIMALPERGIHTFAEFQAAARPGQLSMIHTGGGDGLVWYAVLLGYPVLGVWYWCTDQTIVQRVLGARTERDAQLGPLFAGFLKILPVFIMVLPGVIGYVLFKDEVGSASNTILPLMITKLIPTGLRGLIAAGVLAALMSTIAAALNSTATLVAVDIVKRIRPRIDDRAQVRIGQWSAVAVMLLAMAWSTQGGKFSSIFEAVQTIAAALAPPISTVFLWGVFWRRGTNRGAMGTLILGFLLGTLAFLLDLPAFGPEKLLTETWGIPFMMQAWWMFCFCSLIHVALSLSGPAPPREKLDGLTWDHPMAVITQAPWRGLSDPRLISGVLMLVMAVLYAVFR